MAASYLWYDLETSGIDPARDRIVQFAGVRTNLDLEVIEEPLNLYCRLSDDVIPHPEAMQVTGILPSLLAAEGLTEAAFAARLHAEMARPDTCVTGFNSIRFDDEFTRYLLYRNFYDPYEREWRNGNSRWDVIDLFRMAAALRPEGFVWPTHADSGLPDFRLEAMATANGVEQEHAHDAVSDVLATIGLVAKLRAVQPRLYDYLLRLRDKKAVWSLLSPLGKQAVVHVSAMYGAARGNTALVVPLCTHPTNNNGVLVYDLNIDPEPLLTLGVDEVRRLLFSRTDELGPGEERIAIKLVHVNRAPALAPAGTLSAEAAARLGIDRDRCERHRTRLQQTSGIVEKLQAVYEARSFPPVDDPDLMLYSGGFFGNGDRSVMRKLQAMTGPALAEAHFDFDDQRLPEMLFRYRARSFPATLSDDERELWTAWLWDCFEGGDRLDAERARIDAMPAGHLADELRGRLDHQQTLLD